MRVLVLQQQKYLEYWCCGTLLFLVCTGAPALLIVTWYILNTSIGTRVLKNKETSTSTGTYHTEIYY